jgi:hypothetical protein
MPRDLHTSFDPSQIGPHAPLERALAVAGEQHAKFWERRAAVNTARLWRDYGEAPTRTACTDIRLARVSQILIGAATENVISSATTVRVRLDGTTVN